MKKYFFPLLILLAIISLECKAQTFAVDTARLNKAYRELMRQPKNIKLQKAYFDAFPNTWNEFISTYQYSPRKGYDLTMYRLAPDHIDALATRVNQINDTIYCRKLVDVSVGGMHSADAPNYLGEALHKVMWKKMDVMLYVISQMRRGHQMQFWQFYWSNCVPSEPLEAEYKRMLKLNEDFFPKEMKIMKIAYEYFYDGVNIDGGYLEED